MSADQPPFGFSSSAFASSVFFAGSAFFAAAGLAGSAFAAAGLAASAFGAGAGFVSWAAATRATARARRGREEGSQLLHVQLRG